MKRFIRPSLFLVAAMLLGVVFSSNQSAYAQITPGQLLISEFRFRGPDPDGSTTTANGTNDEFIEIYNNTDAAIDVSGVTLVSLQASGNGTNTLSTIPLGVSIPPRGHYLFTFSSATATGLYSLTSYASSDRTYSTAIADNAGVALCRTATVTNCTGGTGADRIDSVAFTGAGTARPFYIETTGLTPGPTGNVTSAADQFSYVRKFTSSGTSQDTNNNAVDFVLVSTTGSITTTSPTVTFTAILGAPGPENLFSPIRNTAIVASLVNANEPGFGTNNNNYNRDTTPVTNGANGTMSFRRIYTNNTGGTVTRMRLRIRDLTTLNSPGYTLGGSQADLRALTSSPVTVTFTDNTTGTATAITLEEPPNQPNGGGLNSSWTIVPPGGEIEPGATVVINITLGVQQPGSFRFAVNVEAIAVFAQ